MGPFPQTRQIMMHAQLAFATHMGLIVVTFTRADHQLMMIRTPAHHSLLHLIVHTDFMTDIPWNNSIDIISGWCIMLRTPFPVWHSDVHSIIAYASECLMH